MASTGVYQRSAAASTAAAPARADEDVDDSKTKRRRAGESSRLWGLWPIILITLLLLGGVGLMLSRPEGVHIMSIPELHHKLHENNKHLHPLVLLDVRTPEEFATGHIPGSVNTPLRQLESLRESLSAYRDAAVAVVDSGTARSLHAALTLWKDLGFKHVYNVPGGVASWRASGLGLDGVPEPSPEQVAAQRAAAAAREAALNQAAGGAAAAADMAGATAGAGVGAAGESTAAAADASVTADVPTAAVGGGATGAEAVGAGVAGKTADSAAR